LTPHNPRAILFEFCLGKLIGPLKEAALIRAPQGLECPERRK
jgi:hypothetical protein